MNSMKRSAVEKGGVQLQQTYNQAFFPANALIRALLIFNTHSTVKIVK